MTTHKAHCLILPYPAQGHINPMLQFSKRLQSKSVKITIATTKSFLKTMQELSTLVSIEAISDGYDDGGHEQAGSFVTYITRFKEVGSDTLSHLIETLTTRGCPVNCIIYDPFLPWAVEVAKKYGLACAAFFTQSCAVDNIYYYVHKGVIKLPPTEVDEQVLVPGLLTIEKSDVPTFVSNPESAKILEMLVDQFSNLENVDWVLINSFYELEKENGLRGYWEWKDEALPDKAIIEINKLQRKLDPANVTINMLNQLLDTCKLERGKLLGKVDVLEAVKNIEVDKAREKEEKLLKMKMFVLISFALFVGFLAAMMMK
ncbi:UDP-glycosyltransferase 74G1-like isoform X2 [Nicotiana tabacum]|uniref:UDP-glycosyltransferase 74G1-like isoform X2 n=1 Tax=Nicotiana tabacum TaxID=4097 RepID=A0A1S3XPR5_TOBAC|nr:PREDICTED: UDP-glycosyltransferase 74G1-like isoform X2 [Nicotiana tabacum]